MIETNGSAPAGVRDLTQADHLGRYVRRPFRHALRGYSPEEVDEHLRQVRGWFTLAGFDRLLEERREEILGSACREAEAAIEQALREADATIQRARREAETILADAHRRAEEATADAEQRRAAIKTLAREILEEG